MDLDNISADSTFTFAKFQALCVQQGICPRCGQPFDEAHKKVRGCILPNNKHIDIKRKLELFHQWSSECGQSISQIDSAVPPTGSLAPISLNSFVPDSSNPSNLAGHVTLDHIPPLSLADYFLGQAIDEMDIETNIPCTSYDSFFSIPFPSTRPILQAALDCPGSIPVQATVLFDSGLPLLTSNLPVGTTFNFLHSSSPSNAEVLMALWPNLVIFTIVGAGISVSQSIIFPSHLLLSFFLSQTWLWPMLSWASLGFLKTKLLLVVCLGLFLSLSH
jgi:hypothetical protein